MIATTALDLVTSTMKLLGVLAASETPSASEQRDGIAALNAMIDGWGTARQTMLASARQQFDLVADQQAYTIGEGGDFSLEPPLSIDHIGLLFPDTDPAVEVPVPLLTDDQYANLTIKGLPNPLVMAAYYDRSTPEIGTLTFWPIPTGAQSVVLYVPVAITQFSSATEEVTLAPGYYEAMRYNLALRLAPEYSLPVREDILDLARTTLANLKRVNFRIADLSFDPALTGCAAPYNIYSDT